MGITPELNGLAVELRGLMGWGEHAQAMIELRALALELK